METGHGQVTTQLPMQRKAENLVIHSAGEERSVPVLFLFGIFLGDLVFILIALQTIAEG